MRHARISACSLSASVGLLTIACSLLTAAQQISTINAVVPNLINFSGTLTDANGRAVTSVTAVTFALYADQQDGAALWQETQNVFADKNGHYSVMLGSTKPEGLPANLFTSGEARWLGVRINGGEELPRVLLLSVPYALKAADAQTLGR